MSIPPFNIENMPQMLKALPQWVCWMQEMQRGRQTKVPYTPKTGQKAKTTVPATWDTIEAAVVAYQRGGFAGIGFVFANNNIIGIDMDHCLHDGVLHPDADRIVKICNSYTEVSPSGDGVHVLLLGTKPTTACIKPKMEYGGECAVWEHDRFFVMTGRPFGNYPKDLQNRQEELNEVCALVWPQRTAPNPAMVQKVYELKTSGMTVREIAAQTRLSPSTVGNYLSHAKAAQLGHGVESCLETADSGAGASAVQAELDQLSLDNDAVQSEGAFVQPETGDLSLDTSLDKRPVQSERAVVQAETVAVQPKQESVQADRAIQMTDEEILSALPNTQFGKEFEALWKGEWNGDIARHNTQSEADYALCRHLAFCTKDAVQIDRLFRKSGLMRAKWDAGSPGNTYGEKTIQKVLTRVKSQYRGGLHRRAGAHAVLQANTDAAKSLLDRSKAFVVELRASPDLKRLATAITDFLWQLPDLYLDQVKKDLADCLNGSFKVSSFNKAIHQERVQRKKQATAALVAQNNPADKRIMRNHIMTEGVDRKGNPTQIIQAISIDAIRESLLKLTGDWPRRVGNLLFVDDEGEIRYLEDRDGLFAWVQENMPVSWDSGRDAERVSLISKPEFFSHLQANATNYEAIEALPHEPQRENTYYAWHAPEDYTPTGQYLQFLLDHFDNLESPEDMILLKAALMTPAWGGPPGKRPAIWAVATDRGHGKSTVCNVIGDLYGGHIEFQLTHSSEDKLTTRLLTPGSSTLRTVRTDNVNGYFSSPFIEGLITAPLISGHRMFHGEASRPNTLTYLFNGNTVRLSRDMAERSFIIRLRKPQYRPDWEADVYKYVHQYRQHILMDIIAELKKPPADVTVPDRYSEWVKGVLARCGGDTDAIIRLNQDRRGSHDEDREEALEIMDALDEALNQKHTLRIMNIQQQGEDTWDVEPEEWYFIPASEMTSIVERKLNINLSARSVNSKLTGHIAAGRLPRVAIKRTSSERGYVVKNKMVASAKQGGV